MDIRGSCEHKRIGEYLRDAGLINENHIAVALYDQQNTGLLFGEVLVIRGWVDQRTVDRMLHHQSRNQLYSLLHQPKELNFSDETLHCPDDIQESAA